MFNFRLATFLVFIWVLAAMVYLNIGSGKEKLGFPFAVYNLKNRACVQTFNLPQKCFQQECLPFEEESVGSFCRREKLVSFESAQPEMQKWNVLYDLSILLSTVSFVTIFTELFLRRSSRSASKGPIT